MMEACTKQEEPMLITISPEQVERVRALVAPVTAAHFDEGCEPPGYSIHIWFGGPYGNSAEAHCGSQAVDLGEVWVQQDDWNAADAAKGNADE
jgi:hypothetical protein